MKEISLLIYEESNFEIQSPVFTFWVSEGSCLYVVACRYLFLWARLSREKRTWLLFINLINLIFWGTNFRFIAKLSGKYKVPTYPLSSYMHLLLHCGHLPTMWYIVSTDEPPRTHHCHRGSLMVLFILWVWINLKHVSTIIGCRIVSLAFEFSVLYLFISHCSLAPGNHQFFFLIVSIVLYFLWCPMVGII